MTRTEKAFGALGLVAATTLVVQFGIDIGRKGGVVPAAISFFGFFTIWTNILVAFVCLRLATFPEWSAGRISLVTATTMFILFVGVIYHALLAVDHHPEGLSAITNVLMHYLVPAGMLALWLSIVPKGALEWKAALVWLVFPFTYLVFALVRGAILDHYPYFFINVAKYGLSQVLINAVGFTLFLLVLGLAFVGLDKMLSRVRRTA